MTARDERDFSHQPQPGESDKQAGGFFIDHVLDVVDRVLVRREPASTQQSARPFRRSA